MTDSLNAVPQPIYVSYVSINLSDEVGRDDSLMAVRVVPDGQCGKVVFGRSLMPGEPDDGRPIVVKPHEGERLEFRPGALRFSIWDADRNTLSEPDGYKPLTPTLWTWLGLDGPADMRAFNYLLATARRLDGSRHLLGHFWELMTTGPGAFSVARKRMFEALATAEILVVTLGRTIELVEGLGTHLGVPFAFPQEIEDRRTTVRELRNACEHIEDRALGQVRGRPHPDALSIFAQDALLQEGVLTYGQHSLSLREDVPVIIFAARDFVWRATVHFAGEARVLTPPLAFFSGTSQP